MCIRCWMGRSTKTWVSSMDGRLDRLRYIDSFSLILHILNQLSHKLAAWWCTEGPPMVSWAAQAHPKPKQGLLHVR